MNLNAQRLKAIMPRCDVAIWLDPLNLAMQRFEITTPQRMAAFLAQAAHESTETSHLEENLIYSAERLMAVWPKRFPTLEAARPYANNPQKLANHVYAGRGGNGDEASQDGWRYRGRGLFQLTFKDNYRIASKGLGMPLVEQPEMVSTPSVAALAAAHYWYRLGLNALADHQPGDDDEKDFEKITLKINSDGIGMDKRKRYWKIAQQALGVA